MRRELYTAGATTAEVDDLLLIADSLRLLRHSNSVVERKNRSRRGIKMIVVPAAYVLIGIMVSTFIAVIAQVASPDSWLFPVQKASDNVAVMLHPQYREVIMMRRADQVRELAVNESSARAQLGALTSYMEVADEYKNQPHADYAAFRYCESQLSQAAKTATPQVRQAINRSLYSLDTT